jgi:hypothetical protein
MPRPVRERADLLEMDRSLQAELTAKDTGVQQALSRAAAVLIQVNVNRGRRHLMCARRGWPRRRVVLQSFPVA